MDTSTRIILEYIKSELDFKLDRKIAQDLRELYKSDSLSSAKIKLLTAYIEGQNFGAVCKLISILHERWSHDPELLKQINQLEQYARYSLIDINNRITKHKINIKAISHL